MPADFLHQLIEQAYAAAQKSPAAAMQLEVKLRRLQRDRQLWVREKAPNFDLGAPDRLRGNVTDVEQARKSIAASSGLILSRT
jgi:hypothetical protein